MSTSRRNDIVSAMSFETGLMGFAWLETSEGSKVSTRKRTATS
jgi:hypothetical protein